MTRHTTEHLVAAGTASALPLLFSACGSDGDSTAEITPVNAAFAPPGESDTGSWNLQTAGSYAVVCFVPIGSVGEAEGDGPPHFTEGMVHEFTVTTS